MKNEIIDIILLHIVAPAIVVILDYSVQIIGFTAIHVAIKFLKVS